MKTSVALCTYNGELYLSRQLDSILQQTVPIDEIVISDDHSQDSTPHIIRQYQVLHPGIIRYEANLPGLGAKKNFEKALSLCTGDIIFLSDQDDVWMLDKVKKIVDYFEKYPYLDVVFTDGVLINDQGEIIEGTLFKNFSFGASHQKRWRNGKALFELLSGKNRITGATMSIRKSLLDRALPFNLPELPWHDAWVGIHAALSNALGWINEPLIQYRVHASQQLGIVNRATNTFANYKMPRELLVRLKYHETEWLKVTDRVLQTNSSPALIKFKKRKLKTLQLIDFRLSVPASPILRIIWIGIHLPLYFNSIDRPVRWVIKDILKPAL